MFHPAVYRFGSAGAEMLLGSYANWTERKLRRYAANIFIPLEEESNPFTGELDSTIPWE